jgi:hypothetical protein
MSIEQRLALLRATAHSLRRNGTAVAKRKMTMAAQFAEENVEAQSLRRTVALQSEATT